MFSPYTYDENEDINDKIKTININELLIWRVLCLSKQEGWGKGEGEGGGRGETLSVDQRLSEYWFTPLTRRDMSSTLHPPTPIHPFSNILSFFLSDYEASIYIDLGIYHKPTQKEGPGPWNWLVTLALLNSTQFSKISKIQSNSIFLFKTSRKHFCFCFVFFFFLTGNLL